MKSYYVTLNGITILCNEQTIAGWIDYILQNGNVPHIEKVEVA